MIGAWRQEEERDGIGDRTNHKLEVMPRLKIYVQVQTTTSGDTLVQPMSATHSYISSPVMS